MPQTHRMTLREPWQRVVGGETVEFRRAFHRPTNLDAAERVFVAICGPAVAADVMLGEQSLGELLPGSDAMFDVTERLEDRNHLAVVVKNALEGDALPFVEAAIEIRTAAK